MGTVVTYPEQALVSNVQDVLFNYDKAAKTIAITWAGFGSSYKIAVRKHGEENFTELGDTTQTQYVYSGPIQEGAVYEFGFITVDATGKKTVMEISGFIVPVDEPAPTKVKLIRRTISAIEVSWEGDPEKDYIVGYRPAESRRDDYSIVNSKGNSVLIDGLFPRILYDFIVAKRTGAFFNFYTDSLLQA